MDHMPPLNDKQIDLLRHLYRQTGPVLADNLDGRVVRALRSRDLVHERNGWVSLSDAGREHFENVRRRRVHNPHAIAHADSDPRSGRAAAIMKALDALELAVPRDAEVMVGDMPAYADDILTGLRRYARTLSEGPVRRRRIATA